LKNLKVSPEGEGFKPIARTINWLDPRIVFPGHAAAFAFEQRLIGTLDEKDMETSKDKQFEQLQQTSRIDIIARETGTADNFSASIRRLPVE